MNDSMRAAMLEATRLTRAGQLWEATDLIQRVLQGGDRDSAATETGGHSPVMDAPGVIDVVPEAVDVPALHGPGSMPSTDAPRRDRSAGTCQTAMAEPRLRRPLEEVLNRLRNAGLPSGVGGRPWSPDFLDLPSAVPDGASFIAGSFTNHAGTRDYKLYVPSCYRGQALPLVVMLHGCTQDLDDFAAGTRMNAAAEDYSSFVVYPAQASSANCSRCWNWFSVADQQRHRGEPSIIAGITQHIMSTYSVDQERVFVAGFSAGGAMAAVMAMTYPDLYAAVGIHSGLAYEVANDLPSAFAAMRQGGATPRRNDLPKAGRSNRVVPAIVFHGDGDATVHPLNGEQVIAQWRSIMAETGAPPRTAVHRGQVPGGHAYTRTLSTDNGGAAVLEHWLIHGAGHAWSGGSPSGSYADPKGPDAAREMLRFFLEHPARFPVKPH